MLRQKSNNDQVNSERNISDRRAHRRLNVIKRALLFPVIEQMTFPVSNISYSGLAGTVAFPLALRQRVHVCFNDHRYLEASVRWSDGPRVGLELRTPLLMIPAIEPVAPESRDQVPRTVRVSVDLTASLVTSSPCCAGMVRNLSRGGMLIDTPARLLEGELLLVQMNGGPAVLGRVQWSGGRCIGIKFDQEADLDSLMKGV